MSLNKLIAMQAAAKAKPESGDSRDPLPAGVTAQPEPGFGKANAPAESASAPTPSRKLPFANLGNKPTPKPAESPAPAKPRDPLSLDNLGSFDLSNVDEPEVVDSDEFVGFVDEIEATAPDRELPIDMTPEMTGFVDSLNAMYFVLNDTDMFAQSIRQIMMELQENPEYEKLISDQDVHVMIRAMRNTMGLAKIRKQAKQRKTGSAKTRTPSKKQALLDKAMSAALGVSGMGIEID